VILPVDSEHNALFQGLAGHGRDEELKRLILTASGGPFRGKDRAFLETVTREQALAHPNWNMGAKISIDSATLMNKGLELIEACHLYGLPPEMVDVVVHPQSIVHSLVEYVDGSQLAHMGNPDMQVPIAHCLCYPERVTVDVPRLQLASVGTLTFEEPNLDAFPCLRLAREAFDAGPSHPIVLNAANEIAVDAFLKERIGFTDIPAIIEAGLDRHAPVDVSTPETVLALDREVRRETEARL
jgi:1-deoxy-D-xylulose-5-phosphate reductoisomerase